MSEMSMRKVGADYSRIVEIWDPRMALASGAADVVEMPTNSPAVHGHVKDVLGDTHRLYAGVENVL